MSSLSKSTIQNSTSTHPSTHKPSSINVAVAIITTPTLTPVNNQSFQAPGWLFYAIHLTPHERWIQATMTNGDFECSIMYRNNLGLAIPTASVVVQTDVFYPKVIASSASIPTTSLFMAASIVSILSFWLM